MSQITSFARQIPLTARIISIQGNTATVKDSLGKIREIRVDVQRAKGAQPAVGETWLISNDFNGTWTFAAIMGNQPPTPITGSRTGANPITLQLLDALAAAGIVVDNTTV